MTEITIFNNPQFGDIRTAGTADAPLFCLADVCKALGLQSKHVIERLDKGSVSTDTLPTNGGMQVFNFVNEDGLYDVILDSRKPEAKAFRKWVTSEVLPSIRKHGAYMTDAVLEKTLEDPDYIIQLLTAMKKEKELRKEAERQAAIAEQQARALTLEVEDMKVKVSYYDIILNSRETVTTTQIAQDYGMSAKAFNKMLANLHIQRKVNGQWILYADYLKNGYVHSKPFEITRHSGRKDTVMNTEWTQKGRLFLYDYLKEYDIIPLIEINCK